MFRFVRFSQKLINGHGTISSSSRASAILHAFSSDVCTLMNGSGYVLIARHISFIRFVVIYVSVFTEMCLIKYCSMCVCKTTERLCWSSMKKKFKGHIRGQKTGIDTHIKTSLEIEATKGKFRACLKKISRIYEKIHLFNALILLSSTLREKRIQI